MLHIKQQYNAANYHIERLLLLAGHLQSQVYMAHYCQFIYTHLSKPVGREGPFRLPLMALLWKEAATISYFTYGQKRI